MNAGYGHTTAICVRGGFTVDPYKPRYMKSPAGGAQAI